MAGATPAARCLVACAAALLCVGEGAAAVQNGRGQLEAGFQWSTSAAQWPALLRWHSHGNSSSAPLDERARPQQPLAAIEVHGEATPPEDIDTVSHKKLKGNGYTLGSPLYNRQQAFRDGSAAAAAAKAAAEAAAAPHDPGSPGLVVTLCIMIIGCMCVGGAHMINERGGKEPHYDPRAVPATNASLRSPMSAGPSSYQVGQTMPASMSQHPEVMHSQSTLQPSQFSVQHIPSHPALASQQAPLPISSSMAVGRTSSGQMSLPIQRAGSPTHSSPTHAAFPTQQVGSPSHAALSQSQMAYPVYTQSHSPTHSAQSHPVIVSPRSAGQMAMHAQSMPPGAMQSMPPGAMDGSGVQIVDAQPPPNYGTSWQSLPANYGRPGN